MTISHFLLLLFIAIIIYSLFPGSNAQPQLPLFYFSSANISTTWINSQSTRYILLIDASNPLFGCGFSCPGSVCASFLFSIFVGGFNENPQIVWSANRDQPVGENATLEFSQNGDLVLRDSDGTPVWSTNTSGKSVVGMKLNKLGNLVLFDDKNTTVWSSMDHPTDSLVLGQTLRLGQRLTANVSVTNSSQGPVYLTVQTHGIEAFVGSQIYYGKYTDGYDVKNSIFVSFKNGSLDLANGSYIWSIPLPVATSVQYMQLDYGGHLRLYELKDFGWALLRDVFQISSDDCGYPTVCGEYGICSNEQCTCPDSTYFTPINERNPIAGCMPSTAISCESHNAQQFLSLPSVSYFGLDYGMSVLDYDMSDQHPSTDYIMPNSTEESCKQACLSNCSCKAAFFQYDVNASNGYCYLPQELYSLNINTSRGYNSSAFIKVQPFPVKKGSSGVIIAACVGSILSFFLVAFCVISLVRRRYSHREEDDSDEFNTLPGLPTRFAFENLRVATNGFLRKLGEGGFGSVFEGTLADDTKIAVKRLEGVGQGKKEFLAEVETIGRIHHLHLVRLVGFCAEKSHRLLIYEYMLNGSLDKWIFYKDLDTVLDWQTRRKIITHIAMGLTYLHEECRQKIVHLDIKPQNILLDENFNAKVSDFGLAKLIDRDQIEVMTRVRGTPGYLAPEWLTSVITEKVDVFSFGVVVLETVCGRRNIDNSKDEENFHLISILQRKVAENKLVDMVDCRCTDMQMHIEDVIMIMHLAMWCLQGDANKRPLMSVVLDVLKGSMNVEANLDYNFANPTSHVSRNANIVESVQPMPWILSGPR